MKYSLLTALAVLFVSVPFAVAQDCKPPTIVANARAENMFSPEQEMILGELSYQQLAGEIRFGYHSNEAGFGWTNAAFTTLLDALPPSAREQILRPGAAKTK